MRQMCVLHLEIGVPELVHMESPCPAVSAKELIGLFLPLQKRLSRLPLKGHCLLQSRLAHFVP